MKRMRESALVAMGLVLLGLSWPASAASLLVDDFNRGDKPNALGGDFGAWDKDPNDPTQKSTISFDKTVAMDNTGYSLKLEYDVDSPNPAYNGFWMKLQNSDVTPYKKLTFHIKGDPKKGYTPQIKLELKNAKGEVGRYLLKGITDEWQQVSIPLNEFAGMTDWSAMTEFVIVFDDITSTKKTGAIYIDNISFES